jgi:hypothetical protein
MENMEDIEKLSKIDIVCYEINKYFSTTRIVDLQNGIFRYTDQEDHP